ncbi:MAG: fluoride efflux transporter CrcB [Clostridia bacterium]|nr:fluoride efflux transporter CrcB [Clostridia bacterium]
MEYILVGFGGACGSLARFCLGKYISGKNKTVFPLGTLIINISGAFLLGAASALNAGDKIYLLFGDGFLGAYTTFSTFMAEGFQLFQGKKVLNSCIYIAGSLLLGVLGYVLGFELVENWF